VLANCCRYESLMSGEVNMFDVARMNDALAVRAHNQRLAQEKPR
jgi:hypothetical protein